MPTCSLLATTSVPDVFDFEDRLIVRTRADLSTFYLHYDADGVLIGKTILDQSAGLVSATSYLVCSNVRVGVFGDEALSLALLNEIKPS